MSDKKVNALSKLVFNNFVVSLRSIVKQGVSHTINKLTRDAAGFRAKRTSNDQQKERNIRRAERCIAEIKYIKSCHADDIAKFAILCQKPYHEVGNDPNSSIEERVMCRISEHKSLQPQIKKFREEFPNWAAEAPNIIKSIGVNFRKQRLKRLAAKGKLEPVMERERKFFLLLHESLGLELDPKMLISDMGPIHLNKKRNSEEIPKQKLIKEKLNGSRAEKLIEYSNNKNPISKNSEESDTENEHEDNYVIGNSKALVAKENSFNNEIQEGSETSDTAYESEDVVIDSEEDVLEKGSERIVDSEAEAITGLCNDSESCVLQDKKDKVKNSLFPNIIERTLIGKTKNKKSNKLKLVHNIESLIINNESLVTKKDSSITTLDSIFPSFEESNCENNIVKSSNTNILGSSKQKNYIKLLNSSIEKKPSIKSFVKGTCEVKQIDLTNIREDISKVPIKIPQDGTGNIKSQNGNGNKNSFFKRCGSIEYRSSVDENDDNDLGNFDIAAHTTQNYDKNATEDSANDSSKVYNDGLNRFERRRQQFGPVERTGKKRSFSNDKFNRSEDFSSKGTKSKNPRLSYEGKNYGKEMNGGGFNRKDSIPSYQKRGSVSTSNMQPLGNRKPISEVPNSKESLLHPSWAAKKKETEQSSGIYAFQGKKITFDD